MQIGSIIYNMRTERQEITTLMAFQLALVNRLLEDIMACLRLYRVTAERDLDPAERIYLAALGLEVEKLARVLRLDIRMEEG
jgi:hypothetical protein